MKESNNPEAMPFEFREKLQSNFARNLRMLRGRDKMSMYDVEAQTGISHSAIYAYENGIRLPTIDKFMWLCKKTGWKPGELLRAKP